MLKRPSDSALHPQHHKHKKGRTRHMLPTDIQPQRPAKPKTGHLKYLTHHSLRPHYPKIKKLVKQRLGRSSKSSPSLLPPWGHVENLRANSFLERENDENLKGLFNAQERDKKARKYLFDIILTNIHRLRWGDIEDAT